MITKMPGFGPGNAAPTRALLATLHAMLPNASLFAGREDFFTMGEGKQPWPVDGNPKYWGFVHPSRPPMLAQFMRDADGNYMARKFDRANMGLMGNLMSAAALSIVESRGFRLPEVELAPISYFEAARLSFADEIEEPAAYPLTEVWGAVRGGGPTLWYQQVDHRFPTDWVFFMPPGDTVPSIGTVTDVMAAYPLQQANAGSGGDADKVVAMARKLVGSVATRQQANAIINSSISAQQKYAALLGL